MDSKELLDKLRVNVDNQEKRISMLEGYCTFLEQLLEKENIAFFKIDTTKTSVTSVVPLDLNIKNDNKVVGFR